METKRKDVAKIHSRYMEQYDVEMEQHQRKKKRLYRRLTFFVILTVMIFMGLTGYYIKQQAIYSNKKEKYEELQQEMEQLENQEASLNEEIKLLNDEEYVLQIARSNYFFSKDGEIIFKIPDKSPSY